MTPGAATTATTHAYGEASYWDQRYSNDQGAFDWYQKYQSLSPLFDLYLRRHHRLLLVGCGNSALGENMVDDGYQDIVNIDISSVVIEAMQKKYSDKPGLKYVKMDVRDMRSFESRSFDAVIDKGTLDSLMCGQNATENATMMLQEIGRVLKDKGVYILITYGDPSYRLYLLKDVELWTVKIHVIERVEKSPGQKTWEVTSPLPLNEDGNPVSGTLGANPEVHYIYVCTKDDSQRPSQRMHTDEARNEQ
ncbi:methyltransferase-like protein 13 [Canna indica]|uniref:Methyltransferase-like protein 13 n=1 Tax=Canna indica TaxID=4628 RepID=A0AAQ3JXS7_9LILI|nr:methyltransferase-like protein 13 [Canna indica]